MFSTTLIFTEYTFLESAINKYLNSVRRIYRKRCNTHGSCKNISVLNSLLICEIYLRKNKETLNNYGNRLNDDHIYIYSDMSQKSLECLL